jgi:hypothetical protein
VVEAEFHQLAGEGIRVHGSEDKHADAEGGAVFEFFAGVREDGDGGKGGFESRAEVGFEFGEGDVGEDFGVELVVGEAKAAAELFAVERGDVVLAEDGVGGIDDGAQVIDEGAGPVEDEVVEHEERLLVFSVQFSGRGGRAEREVKRRRGLAVGEADAFDGIGAEVLADAGEEFGFHAFQLEPESGLGDAEHDFSVLDGNRIGVGCDEVAGEIFPSRADLVLLEAFDDSGAFEDGLDEFLRAVEALVEVERLIIAAPFA